jgi:hypothetical protein
MKYAFASMLLASGFAHAITCTNLPEGATALGYTTQVFYDQPTMAEVSASDNDTTSKWYPGTFAHTVASNLVSRELLSTVGSQLAISLGSGVSSETQLSKAGALPFLNGAQGFYVEVAMHLSTNDSDHFAGVYLGTVEHDLAKHDHIATDPPGFERWTEIDIAESGYTNSSLESVINWAGIYPHYNERTYNSYGHDAAIDWTTEHRFGVSWDPATNTLQYYLDDKPTWKVVPPNAVIKNFHYFLVLEASSHGSHTPYEMMVHYVTAYTK